VTARSEISNALLLLGRIRRASGGPALVEDGCALVGGTECDDVGCFVGVGEVFDWVKAPPPPPTGGGGTFVVVLAGGVLRGRVECALVDGAGDVGGAGVLELCDGGWLVGGRDVGLGSVVMLRSPPTLNGPPTETLRPSRLRLSRCPGWLAESVAAPDGLAGMSAMTTAPSMASPHADNARARPN
jgi:hypothetical protein